MPDIPQYFLQGDRGEDQTFAPDERLYRRLQPGSGDEVEIDAVELPDISCERAKYCRPTDCLWSESERFKGWGVFSFPVKAIVPRLSHLGIKIYCFRAVHVPQARRYQHSEVRAFDETGTIHIGKAEIEMIDRETQLRFRQKIVEYSQILIKPDPVAS